MLPGVAAARGSFTVRRMSAHWVALTAAALTSFIAGALATALAVLAGQALPLAVQHDPAVAPGTELQARGPVPAGQAAATARRVTRRAAW